MEGHTVQGPRGEGWAMAPGAWVRLLGACRWLASLPPDDAAATVEAALLAGRATADLDDSRPGLTQFVSTALPPPDGGEPVPLIFKLFSPRYEEGRGAPVAMVELTFTEG